MKYSILDNLTLYEKKLNEQEFNTLMSCVSELTAISSEIDYYRIVMQNINDFLDLQKLVQIESYNNFVILNSKLANWLNSYYMWKTFNNNNFKSLFDGLHKEYRNHSVFYKLADVLRDHVVHESFLISIISFDVLNETTSYHIKPEAIVDNGYSNAMVRQWLKEKMSNNETIDVISYTKEFLNVFDDIQNNIWKILCPDIIKNMDLCIQLFDFKYSDIRNLIVYEKSNEFTSHRKMVGRFIYLVKQKIKDSIPEHYIQLTE